MSYTEVGHKQAKSDMLGEFNKAIAGAEDLRKAADQAADDAAAARKPAGKPEGTGGDTAGAPDASAEAAG